MSAPCNASNSNKKASSNLISEPLARPAHRAQCLHVSEERRSTAPRLPQAWKKDVYMQLLGLVSTMHGTGKSERKTIAADYGTGGVSISFLHSAAVLLTKYWRNSRSLTRCVRARCANRVILSTAGGASMNDPELETSVKTCPDNVKQSSNHRSKV